MTADNGRYHFSVTNDTGATITQINFLNNGGGPFTNPSSSEGQCVPFGQPPYQAIPDGGFGCTPISLTPGETMTADADAASAGPGKHFVVHGSDAASNNYYGDLTSTSGGNGGGGGGGGQTCPPRLLLAAPQPPCVPAPDTSLTQGGKCANPVNGTGGDDVLGGGNKNDRISGKDGKDFLFGFDGADCLKGDAGNDVSTGGDGNDDIDGGKGTYDYLSGEGGDDKLDGVGSLDGGPGNDFLAGGPDVIGGAGNDSAILPSFARGHNVDMGAGRDIVDANNNDKDTIDCGSGSDVVWADGKNNNQTEKLKGCERVALTLAEFNQFTR